jgi:2-amino-4-hydroxy-6-hydroxymethyldihydropteridine diphosphokinase
MQTEKTVFLLTGSNIEPRFKFLEQADKEIGLKVGKIELRSSIYESDPWGFATETAFFNQVLIVKTKYSAIEILAKIQSIEKALGRIRKEKEYLSRTIDIDILYYENKIIEVPGLTVPHPRLHERKFSLLPLVEVAAGFIHPVLKRTNDELLRNVQDQSLVWKTDIQQRMGNV